ncbi:MAG: NAD-dependent epimerase/dehydratase family protein [Actinomycetota bacterium]|nr:NAD-dependent epimerase/dehydratase family protein [Actinomycetota bacterium]
MKVAVTGADGFLGWHLLVRLGSRTRHEVRPIPRSVFADDCGLQRGLAGADAVVHLAGVNRDTPEAVETGNIHLAERLTGALDSIGIAPSIIFANSTQAGADTPYGRGKARAADALRAWADRRATTMVDLILPNLFGECGRPDYNSFVATFCHRLAHDQEPRLDTDRLVPLLHAQDAAALIENTLDHLDHLPSSESIHPEGRPLLVSSVLGILRDLSAVYAAGRFPDLSDPFVVQLFNTYRSYLYPHWYPQPLVAKADQRGSFVEAVWTLGGTGQTSFSTTRPGITRGNHYHLRKIERFVVVRGTADISIRPVGRAAVHTFRVSGDTPAFVDMPTLHTHNITNTGHDELWTLFWTNELFDPGDPDTYPEPVA